MAWGFVRTAMLITAGIYTAVHFSAHPWRLVAACVIASPVIILIARRLFTNANQFAEDYGLTSEERSVHRALDLESRNNEFGRYASPPTFDMTIIWFLIQCATLIAAGYYVTGYVLEWLT